MLEYDFQESIGFWIHMTAHLYERAMNAELTSEGITYRQFQVLGWLALDGELSQVELAERMRIEPPTLVGVLDRMEREGWIVRESSPTDRRRKIIKAEPKAEPVWRKMVACARRVRERAAGGLSEEEFKQLRDLLARVQANFEPRAQRRVAAPAPAEEA